MNWLPQLEKKLSRREAGIWLKALEALATLHGFATPPVYAIVFFKNVGELDLRKLVEVTEDVFVGDGVVAVRYTEVPPVLAQRLLTGYYSLCLLAENKHVCAEEVIELAKNDLWLFLTLISQQFFA